jgi:steroid 5-alpha reductase family enzyme
MNMIRALGLVWALAIVAMSVGFLWQQRRRNAGIADVLWAGCLSASALVCAWVARGSPVARGAVAMLGGLWGARLALHLWGRVHGAPEDGRWHHLRTLWRDDGLRWFGMFQAQALLVGLFSVPFAAAAGNTRVGLPQLGLAVLIFGIALAGESVADRQLAAFRRDPKNRGRTCRTGLWRYSRHPNYFFEWLHWFSYVALAFGAPHGALAWLGPLSMWLFLRYVSGIPFTEAQALRSRGDDYRDYQRQTSMLIPWPPRGVLRGPEPEDQKS